MRSEQLIRGGLSVVVPTYNSEASLPSLYSRLRPVLEQLTDEFEIVFVNDGSRDRTWGVIAQLSQTNSLVRGIDLARNFGQHNALMCGIGAAKFTTVVTLDDDLQHPPEEIPRLIAKLDEGFDVVYGRPAHDRHGLLRTIASRMTKLALRGAMGVDVAGDVSAFRALRLPSRGHFSRHASSFVSVDVVLSWQTTRFASVLVEHSRRAHGSSNYTVRKLVRHALNMMTGYSVIPLQIASAVGFFFTLFGIGVLTYVIARYFMQGVTVPGFAFLASVIALFSGAQLFALGVIGEYLARIHFRVMDKPLYVVRATTGTEDAAGLNE